jgi:hypothetical protein
MKREPSARRHPMRAVRAPHRLRRHAIALALVVGGVGLAAADVSVGIGWGLALVGAALAVQPSPGSTSESSGQAGTASARSRTGHSRRRPQRPPQDGATTPSRAHAIADRRASARVATARPSGRCQAP